MNHGGLADILILLGLAVVVMAVFRRMSLPPILGYLFVGLATGPYALGWLENSEVTRSMGEIGVVFLLFTIGLEFSIPQFLAMRKTLLGLGGTQVLVGTISGGLIAWMLGISWQAAVIVGGALAMSSTAIVVKQLTDQLELTALHGRLALGILLFQDLAAVPFLVVIPILSVGEGSGESVAPVLSWALLQGAVAFVALLVFGRRVLRPLFYEVAASRSQELFTLTVLLVSLAAAWITSLLGLSLALGAFLAGMMLSETEFRHQVETDIRPFRDVLLGLFFVTIGMQLDVPGLISQWPWIALLLAGLVLGKGLLIVLLTHLAGYDSQSNLRTGLVLAHGGEFGFALLALALDDGHGLLTIADSQPILAALVLSMTLAPVLIRYNGPLAKRIFAHSAVDWAARGEEQIAQAMRASRGHVIICGFGRIGQNMGSFLRDAGFDYAALDLEPARVRDAWEAGELVFYGDATHREILQAAGLERAKALVISFNDERAALRILHVARNIRRDLPVLVRSHDESSLEPLLNAGATEVVPETLEASLMLAVQLLVMLQVPMDEIVGRVQAARGDRYRRLRLFFRRAEAERTREAGRDRARLRTVLLPAGAHAVGRRLEQLGLEEQGIEVKAVRRGDSRAPRPPNPDLILKAGDVLVLAGRPEQLAYAEQRLLRG